MKDTKNTGRSRFNNIHFFIVSVIVGLVLLILLGLAWLLQFHQINFVKNEPLLKTVDPINRAIISCPSLASFCQNAIYKESSMSGTLKKGDPIYAAFDGHIVQVGLSGRLFNDKQDYFNFFVLANDEKNLHAFYYFKGDFPKNKNVKEGDVIAIDNGQNIPYLGTVFAFKLFDTQTKFEKTIRLSAKSFK